MKRLENCSKGKDNRNLKINMEITKSARERNGKMNATEYEKLEDSCENRPRLISFLFYLTPIKFCNSYISAVLLDSINTQ